MSIAINGMDGNPWTPKDMDSSGNNVVTTYHQLAFSGSYTTAVNGDTLDLSTIAKDVPSGSLPLQIVWEANGPVGSFSKGGGYLQIEKGSTLANNKFKVFTAGGAEQGTGTYASIGLAADVVTLVISWRKLN